MLPLRIEGFTRVLAKEQPEYMQLAIKDWTRDVNGHPVNGMSSLWEVSPKEAMQLSEDDSHGIQLTVLGHNTSLSFLWDLTAEQRLYIASGGQVILSIGGDRHPPVRLQVVSKRGLKPRFDAYSIGPITAGITVKLPELVTVI